MLRCLCGDAHVEHVMWNMYRLHGWICARLEYIDHDGHDVVADAGALRPGEETIVTGRPGWLRLRVIL